MTPGVRVRGDRAEVWQGAAHTGNIYRYVLEGFDGKWTVWAKRYSLTTAYQQEESEFRFFIEAEGKVALELRGTGHIISEVEPNGEIHRQEIDMEGTRLWLLTADRQVS